MCTSAASFDTGIKQPSEPPVSYDEALMRIGLVARSAAASRSHSSPCSRVRPSCLAQDNSDKKQSSLMLLDAVGRKSAKTVYAPYSTPLNDTSAMDGYVVNASLTTEASKDRPVRLRIIDSIAAGDSPKKDSPLSESTAERSKICAEIMTGACFPESLPWLDSVVKIEDVSLEPSSSEHSSIIYSYIVLAQPVRKFQHRRLAGSDFAKGDVIIEHGMVIQPKHVAALASLGFTDIEVSIVSACTRSPSTMTKSIPDLRVGVLSTGSEIVSGLNKKGDLSRQNGISKQAVPDSNGPYIVSNLEASCHTITAQYLGIVRDDEEEMVSRLRKSIFQDTFDIIITSGGVSKGRHDLVRHVVEKRLKGRVVFHGIKIRPGAPILLAYFDTAETNIHGTGRRQKVFFGVPGNPLAAAVALRFFVVPYILRTIQGDAEHLKQELHLSHCEESKNFVSLQQRKNDKNFEHMKPIRHKPSDCTVFWLARWQSKTFDSVELLDDQASHKLRGLLEADCWITVPAGSTGAHSGELLLASPL